ncbi:MAG: hypothetical protein AAGI23_19330 [Bacteroidota bacterium]
MNTIQLEVSDEMVKNAGLDALKARLYRFLELEELRLSALRIQKAVEAASEDHDALFETARAEAWTKFKAASKGLSTTFATC